MAYGSEHKDIERSFKRPSGWTKAFAGIAAALALVIVGILAAGAVSGGKAANSAATPVISQDIVAISAEDGSEVIADNETPMAEGLETMRASAIGGGMRVIVVAGIAMTVVVFGWLMHRENRSISVMRRRTSSGGDSETRD